MENDELYKAIGEKIKALRIKKGYSSAETFAYDNDFPRISYQRLEKGTNITLKSLVKILATHNLSLSEFFNSFKEKITL